MPPRSKVEQLPADIKAWLQSELKARSFSGYVELTDELNRRLAEAGSDETIGKSSVHAYGQGFEEFIKYQDQASAWAASWMNDMGLEEEAKRHNVLFQMASTLAFKVMQGQMTKDADDVDPRDLHFLGKLMKDLMSSSGIREKLREDERQRVARLEREAVAEELDQKAHQLGMTAQTVESIKEQILFGGKR